MVSRKPLPLCSSGRVAAKQQSEKRRKEKKLKYLTPLMKATTNYKEAFALFDKRGNGRIPLSSLGDLLRACGQNPTNAEVDDLIHNSAPKGDCEYPLPSPPPPFRELVANNIWLKTQWILSRS